MTVKCKLFCDIGNNDMHIYTDYANVWICIVCVSLCVCVCVCVLTDVIELNMSLCLYKKVVICVKIINMCRYSAYNISFIF